MECRNKVIRTWIILGLLAVVVLYPFLPKKSVSGNTKNKIVSVTAQPLISTLYYTGTIQPIKIGTITSPTEGIIDKKLFQFGDTVKAGQVLFLISSEKLYEDYKIVLMQYIKSRSDYIVNQSQLEKNQFLHRNKLISEDEYKAKELNFYNAQLDMLQAKLALASLLKKLDIREFNIYKLKIADIDKITHLLAVNHKFQIKITTLETGIIFQPPKGDNPEGELKRITIGDPVKVDDILGVIGDTSQMLVHINVNEFNINQIKLGQVVEVTGNAFPSEVLTGKVISINRQGEASQTGGATFPVDIAINSLTKEQQNVIRIGMSVKVAINIVEGEKVSVPLEAIIERNNAFYVKVQNANGKGVHEVPITLGKTNLDSVIVEENLRVGDKIVITH